MYIFLFYYFIRMPLSAAEKQQLCRQRRDVDPERRQKYLEKERMKWRKDKEMGKKLPIGQRRKRREWRAVKVKCR